MRHALRPDEKAAAIERLRAQGKTVCMVGDGINDTPALAVADCAVAMGGGSDIAIESAGILLPSGNLEKLPELKGCQAHSTVMLTEGDFKVFKKLGVELTNDPIYETK